MRRAQAFRLRIWCARPFTIPSPTPGIPGIQHNSFGAPAPRVGSAWERAYGRSSPPTFQRTRNCELSAFRLPPLLEPSINTPAATSSSWLDDGQNRFSGRNRPSNHITSRVSPNFGKNLLFAGFFKRSHDHENDREPHWQNCPVLLLLFLLLLIPFVIFILLLLLLLGTPPLAAATRCLFGPFRLTFSYSLGSAALGGVATDHR